MHQKLKSFMVQCGRVWRILRKPNAQEFKANAKISAIAIILLGLVGFVISLIIDSLI